MICFETIIEDKKNYIGWVHAIIPFDVAEQLHNNKKAFAIKGKIDDYAFEGISLLPAGEGNYYMPINASLRKKIGKQPTNKIMLCIEKDVAKKAMLAYIAEPLSEFPEAVNYFNTLPKGHQKYFINYIESAKTETTKTKRIVAMINTLERKEGYAEMIRRKEI